MSRRVKIDSVTKTYGEVTVVDKVSLDIEKGEFFTLLGPSGCGKTTLLRMIAGFNEINGGTISFDDRVINDLPPQKRNIGMVFQNYAIFPHMSVRDNVAYGLKKRKIKGEELTKKVNEAMELMQIAQYADRAPSKLSGGQQQRVALARAIVITPEILLMDEPLSNLDAKLRVEMRTSIRKIQKSLGITTIYVTHDQEEALAISDRIAVMKDGVVSQVGEPEEIYKKPNSKFVAGFIGTSCFIPAKASQGVVSVQGKRILTKTLRDNYQGDVIISARPENIVVAGESSEQLCGTITLATFLGDYVAYEIEMDDKTILEVNEYTAQKLPAKRPGQRISLKFEAERTSIYTLDGQEELS